MGNYVGSAPSRQRDTQNRVTYIAADGQTTFAATYTPGYVDVYLNGAKLQGPTGADFTASNGTSVVLAVPASLGDVVEIVAISASSPYDFYTKAQTDAKVGGYYGIAVGTSDALSVTTTPLITALTDGVEIKVRTASANTTSVPTLTFSNLGIAKTIVAPGGAAVNPGIWITGQEITVRYNATSDKLELITLNFPQATNSQAATGTANNVVITPLSLVGAFALGQVKSPNGYQKLPGGVVIQWGVASFATGGTITFPIAFPTQAASISLAPNNTGVYSATTSGLTQSTATVVHSAGASVLAIYWIAMGY
jgi:hypothetical protein